jgi:hypothetical protein
VLKAFQSIKSYALPFKSARNIMRATRLILVLLGALERNFWFFLKSKTSKQLEGREKKCCVNRV